MTPETLLPDHQSKKKPDENKFHKGNGSDGKHYWLTPPDIYHAMDSEFSFDFDPCPYPLPEGFDGLTCEWGSSSYVNPPFGSIIHQGKKKGPTAWARKAVAESKKGKDVVLVYPIDKWVLMLLAAGAEVRNLGDVRWLATEDGSQGKGTGRHIAQFILRGKSRPTPQAQGAVEEEISYMRHLHQDLVTCHISALLSPEKLPKEEWYAAANFVRQACVRAANFVQDSIDKATLSRGVVTSVPTVLADFNSLIGGEIDPKDMPLDSIATIRAALEAQMKGGE